MANFGSKDTKIHVANDTGETMYVIPMPNADWTIADSIFGTVVSGVLAVATAGLGSGAVVSTGVSVATKLAKVASVINLIRQIGKIPGAIFARQDEEKLKANMRELEDMVRREGITIPAGEFRQVNDRSLIRPLDYIFGLNGWAQLFEASDYSLVILNQSFTRCISFNTHSDYSWIVKPNEVVRAKYKTIWQEARDEGFGRFPRWPALVAGVSLLPGECLVSPDGGYDLVFQEDRNVVLYERNWPKKEKAIWSSQTQWADAARLTLQEDGNLVLYKANGEPLVALNDYGAGDNYSKRRLYVSKEGRAILEGPSGAKIWDSKQAPERFQLKK